MVTGATGFVGKRICRKLFSDGHTLVVIARNAIHARQSIGIPCDVFELDLNLQTPGPECFVGIDAVIHLAGEPVSGSRWSADRKQRIMDSRVKGSRHLLDAIEALDRVHRPKVIVSASAIGYYGDRGDEVLTDQSAPGSGFLSEVCQQWEAETIKRTIPGVRQVALRLGVVLGRGGGALEELIPLFGAGLGSALGNGSQWMSWVHLDDVIRLFAFALTHSDFSGIYNCVAPHPVTNRHFTAAFSGELKTKPFIPVPRIALRAALGEMSSIVLHSQRIERNRVADLGFTFLFSKLEAALHDICQGQADSYFEATQFVQRPLTKVFEFFSDAHNLESITPPWVHFKILNVSTPAIQQGTLIDYSLRIHGVPVQWRTQIDEWNPPHQFVDHQLKGPYSKWDHTHSFQEAQGGTLMVDRVRYRVPIGALGQAVAGAFVRNDVEKIFGYRHSVIEKRFA